MRRADLGDGNLVSQNIVTISQHCHPVSNDVARVKGFLATPLLWRFWF